MRVVLAFYPPPNAPDQRPCIDAPAVADAWARLPREQLLDHLGILGRDERRLVVAELAALGIEVGRP